MLPKELLQGLKDVVDILTDKVHGLDDHEEVEVPTVLHDGSDVKSIEEVAAIMGVQPYIAAVFALQSPDITGELAVEAKSIIATENKVRHVATEAGVTYYDQPLGSIIVRDVGVLRYIRDVLGKANWYEDSEGTQYHVYKDEGQWRWMAQDGKMHSPPLDSEDRALAHLDQNVQLRGIDMVKPPQSLVDRGGARIPPRKTRKTAKTPTVTDVRRVTQRGERRVAEARKRTAKKKRAAPEEWTREPRYYEGDSGQRLRLWPTMSGAWIIERRTDAGKWERADSGSYKYGTEAEEQLMALDTGVHRENFVEQLIDLISGEDQPLALSTLGDNYLSGERTGHTYRITEGRTGWFAYPQGTYGEELPDEEVLTADTLEKLVGTIREIEAPHRPTKKRATKKATAPSREFVDGGGNRYRVTTNAEAGEHYIEIADAIGTWHPLNISGRTNSYVTRGEAEAALREEHPTIRATTVKKRAATTPSLTQFTNDAGDRYRLSTIGPGMWQIQVPNSEGEWGNLGFHPSYSTRALAEAALRDHDSSVRAVGAVAKKRATKKTSRLAQSLPGLVRPQPERTIEYASNAGNRYRLERIANRQWIVTRQQPNGEWVIRGSDHPFDGTTFTTERRARTALFDYDPDIHLAGDSTDTEWERALMEPEAPSSEGSWPALVEAVQKSGPRVVVEGKLTLRGLWSNNTYTVSGANGSYVITGSDGFQRSYGDLSTLVAVVNRHEASLANPHITFLGGTGPGKGEEGDSNYGYTGSNGNHYQIIGRPGGSWHISDDATTEYTSLEDAEDALDAKVGDTSAHPLRITWLPSEGSNTYRGADNRIYRIAPSTLHSGRWQVEVQGVDGSWVPNSVGDFANTSAAVDWLNEHQPVEADDPHWADYHNLTLINRAAMVFSGTRGNVLRLQHDAAGWHGEYQRDDGTWNRATIRDFPTARDAAEYLNQVQPEPLGEEGELFPATVTTAEAPTNEPFTPSPGFSHVRWTDDDAMMNVVGRDGTTYEPQYHSDGAYWTLDVVDPDGTRHSTPEGGKEQHFSLHANAVQYADRLAGSMAEADTVNPADVGQEAGIYQNLYITSRHDTYRGRDGRLYRLHHLDDGWHVFIQPAAGGMFVDQQEDGRAFSGRYSALYWANNQMPFNDQNQPLLPPIQPQAAETFPDARFGHLRHVTEGSNTMVDERGVEYTPEFHQDGVNGDYWTLRITRGGDSVLLRDPNNSEPENIRHFANWYDAALWGDEASGDLDAALAQSNEGMGFPEPTAATPTLVGVGEDTEPGGSSIYRGKDGKYYRLQRRQGQWRAEWAPREHAAFWKPVNDGNTGEPIRGASLYATFNRLRDEIDRQATAEAPSPAIERHAPMQTSWYTGRHNYRVVDNGRDSNEWFVEVLARPAHYNQEEVWLPAIPTQTVFASHDEAVAALQGFDPTARSGRSTPSEALPSPVAATAAGGTGIHPVTADGTSMAHLSLTPDPDIFQGDDGRKYRLHQDEDLGGDNWVVEAQMNPPGGVWHAQTGVIPRDEALRWANDRADELGASLEEIEGLLEPVPESQRTIQSWDEALPVHIGGTLMPYIREVTNRPISDPVTYRDQLGHVYTLQMESVGEGDNWIRVRQDGQIIASARSESMAIQEANSRALQMGTLTPASKAIIGNPMQGYPHLIVVGLRSDGVHEGGNFNSPDGSTNFWIHYNTATEKYEVDKNGVLDSDHDTYAEALQAAEAIAAESPTTDGAFHPYNYRSHIYENITRVQGNEFRARNDERFLLVQNSNGYEVQNTEGMRRYLTPTRRAALEWMDAHGREGYTVTPTIHNGHTYSNIEGPSVGTVHDNMDSDHYRGANGKEWDIIWNSEAQFFEVYRNGTSQYGNADYDNVLAYINDASVESPSTFHPMTAGGITLDNLERMPDVEEQFHAGSEVRDRNGNIYRLAETHSESGWRWETIYDDPNGNSRVMTTAPSAVEALDILNHHTLPADGYERYTNEGVEYQIRPSAVPGELNLHRMLNGAWTPVLAPNGLPVAFSDRNEVYSTAPVVLRHIEEATEEATIELPRSYAPGEFVEGRIDPGTNVPIPHLELLAERDTYIGTDGVRYELRANDDGSMWTVYRRRPDSEWSRETNILEDSRAVVLQRLDSLVARRTDMQAEMPATTEMTPFNNFSYNGHYYDNIAQVSVTSDGRDHFRNRAGELFVLGTDNNGNYTVWRGETQVHAYSTIEEALAEIDRLAGENEAPSTGFDWEGNHYPNITQTINGIDSSTYRGANGRTYRIDRGAGSGTAAFGTTWKVYEDDQLLTTAQSAVIALETINAAAALGAPSTTTDFTPYEYHGTSFLHLTQIRDNADDEDQNVFRGANGKYYLVQQTPNGLFEVLVGDAPDDVNTPDSTGVALFTRAGALSFADSHATLASVPRAPTRVDTPFEYEGRRYNNMAKVDANGVGDYYRRLSSGTLYRIEHDTDADVFNVYEGDDTERVAASAYYTGVLRWINGHPAERIIPTMPENFRPIVVGNRRLNNIEPYPDTNTVRDIEGNVYQIRFNNSTRSYVAYLNNVGLAEGTTQGEVLERLNNYVPAREGAQQTTPRLSLLGVTYDRLRPGSRWGEVIGDDERTYTVSLIDGRWRIRLDALGATEAAAREHVRIPQTSEHTFDTEGEAYHALNADIAARNPLPETPRPAAVKKTTGRPRGRRVVDLSNNTLKHIRRQGTGTTYYGDDGNEYTIIDTGANRGWGEHEYEIRGGARNTYIQRVTGLIEAQTYLNNYIGRGGGTENAPLSGLSDLIGMPLSEGTYNFGANGTMRISRMGYGTDNLTANITTPNNGVTITLESLGDGLWNAHPFDDRDPRHSATIDSAGSALYETVYLLNRELNDPDLPRGAQPSNFTYEPPTVLEPGEVTEDALRNGMLRLGEYQMGNTGITVAQGRGYYANQNDVDTGEFTVFIRDTDNLTTPEFVVKRGRNLRWDVRDEEFGFRLTNRPTSGAALLAAIKARRNYDATKDRLRENQYPNMVVDASTVVQASRMFSASVNGEPYNIELGIDSQGRTTFQFTRVNRFTGPQFRQRGFAAIAQRTYTDPHDAIADIMEVQAMVDPVERIRELARTKKLKMKFVSRDQGSVSLNDPSIDPEIAAWVVQAFEGAFGKANMRSEVNFEGTQVYPDAMYVNGWVYDNAGHQVGTWQRTINRRSRELHNDLLSMNEGVQGQGFAEGFYHHIEQFVAENGITTVTVDAGLTVGKYAWARRGFDIVSNRSGMFHGLADRLERIKRNPPAEPFTEGQLALIDHFIKRLRDADPRLTMLEVASFSEGWYDWEGEAVGSGKPMPMHLGKKLLLDNGGWSGQKDVLYGFGKKSLELEDADEYMARLMAFLPEAEKLWEPGDYYSDPEDSDYNIMFADLFLPPRRQRRETKG